MIWTVGEAMSPDPVRVGESDTVLTIASLMREHDIGAVPVCFGRGLRGIVTDRDIIVRCIAIGKDPASTLARDVQQERPATVAPDDLLDEAMLVMITRRVRRVPVVSGHRLVGMLALADIAKAVDPVYAGEVLRGISIGQMPR